MNTIATINTVIPTLLNSVSAVSAGLFANGVTSHLSSNKEQS